MNKLLADAISVVCPLFKPGLPHLRENVVIPIWTASHFVAYDVDRRSPLYAYCRLDANNLAVAVDRKDSFISGDYTLDDGDVTSSRDYQEHNAANPEEAYDRGHQIGSQFRRASDLEQSDVDILAGCCPETPELNRYVKSPLESAIRERAIGKDETYLCAGPVFCTGSPARLNGNQVIPDFLFISTFMKTGVSYEHSTFLMANVRNATGARAESISLDEFENVSGLVLWGSVRSSKFRRDRAAHWYQG